MSIRHRRRSSVLRFRSTGLWDGYLVCKHFGEAVFADLRDVLFGDSVTAKKSIFFVDKDATEIGATFNCLVKAFFKLLLFINLRPFAIESEHFLPWERFAPNSVRSFMVQHFIKAIKQRLVIDIEGSFKEG
jgi:hypothetical protein